MKSLFSVFLSLVVVASFAQGGKSVDTEITNVTVFLSGAQVHREAGISLKAGENVLKLTGLTQYLDANSIQVEGNADYLIKGVKHSLNYLNDATLEPEIKEKKDSLEQLKFTLDTRTALESVYQEEKQMIIANRSVKGTEGVLLAEDIEEVADFFRERLREVEYKMLDLKQEKKRIQEDITRIQNHLNSLNANRNKVNSEILVTLIANKSLNSKLDLTYIVRQAGWMPVYDIRAEDTDSPIELRYKANVWQSTGNNWNSVKLTLSTGNPSVGGQAPTLYPWWLNIVEKSSRNRGADMYSIAKQPQAMEQMDMEMPMEGFISGGSMANMTTIQENAINTEFNIAIPYDIPSDNQQHEVETQRITLQAGYEHLAIPKRDKDAFLTAQVMDWQKHNLLPGESNVYFKGTFVGKAFIDPAVADDTLSLSLGRDKAVIVKSVQIDELCKTSTFGGKKRTEKAYRITVHNTKSSSIKLTLKDQIPKSNMSDVEVEVVNISGAKYDVETGELIWDLNLAPSAIKEVEVRFSVKYPKKKVVTNL